MQDNQDVRISVIGTGYVGLPVAVAFAQHYPVVAFDISTARIEELRNGIDSTREVTSEELQAANRLSFVDSEADLTECNVHIVTVPTPVDQHKRPDFTALVKASETVGRVLSKGDIVIYESTVYPGATEEICVPVVERVSGLTFNADFTVGYSPERINPSDKVHRLADIVKVTSGSTQQAAAFVDMLYGRIVSVGTHQAPSIRAAEAAKVIENIQRDVNIALINELTILFNRMDIDAKSVLEAAGTKWNFLGFRPGLVGGHCVGVDPYYLTHKAQELGFHPEMILAGRRINDGMADHAAGMALDALMKRGIAVKGARALVLGLTFKENCPDLRNTKVSELVEAFCKVGMDVDVHDPVADAQAARAECAIDLVADPQEGIYDLVVLAVSHREFAAMGAPAIRALLNADGVLFDLKWMLPDGVADLRL
ncbi:MAG: nucleotide sugar dehydrogenase [Alphaproteobacteria bacterium]|nr:nucleotide sugar dehydrogenase [Alphaproteobacteria bacterium]